MTGPLSWLNSNFIPGISDRLRFGAAVAIAAFGVRHSAPSKTDESCRPPQVLIADGVVPNLPGLNPCVSAQRCCEQVKRMVGNAGVYVNTAIILSGIDIFS